MTDPVAIELHPLGKRIEVERGGSLRSILFAHGVEFPCGGLGRCRGCRVRVLRGSLENDANTAEIRLTESERKAGWRLACQCRAVEDVTLELEQWETPILGDNADFAFEPGTGYGVAIDLGTTTVVGQLLDRKTGKVKAVESALNSQSQHGADIMTRIQFGMTDHNGSTLRALIRSQIDALIQDLIESADVPVSEIGSVVIVGNTAMHHLFSGLDLEPLSRSPFETPNLGPVKFRPTQLDWDLSSKCEIQFLPCLGSFVGSDILAGILATKMHQSDSLTALVDLGTNGEIAIGNRDSVLCASTAGGPAFEGACISMGMRAATGAISRAEIRDGALQCHVIGGGKARGICGSGLVDLVAALLELGEIKTNGRFRDGGDSITVADSVILTQQDIRELQLAKGAISAGIQSVLEKRGCRADDLQEVYLVGAFGNYLSPASARRIGLLDFAPEVVQPVGNAAMVGAKMILFESPHAKQPVWESILSCVEHVDLGSDPEFMDAFVGEMSFPPAA